jgi:alkylation response protein AidB-like acyl-CoA dehydrogenase
MLKDAGKPYIKDAAQVPHRNADPESHNMSAHSSYCNAAQAKLMASETATYAAHAAIQILGGMGCALLGPYLAPT